MRDPIRELDGLTGRLMRRECMGIIAQTVRFMIPMILIIMLYVAALIMWTPQP